MILVDWPDNVLALVVTKLHRPDRFDQTLVQPSGPGWMSRA
jgi:hypothetical protein